MDFITRKPMLPTFACLLADIFQTLTQSADITMIPRLAFVAALCCLAASRLTAVSAQTTTGQVGLRSIFATQILN